MTNPKNQIIGVEKRGKFKIVITMDDNITLDEFIKNLKAVNKLWEATDKALHGKLTTKLMITNLKMD